MFYISGVTDKGEKMDINQDCFAVQKYETSIGEVVFACLCDGMGGFEDGEKASATVLNDFLKWSSNFLPYLTTKKLSKRIIVSNWKKVINSSNEKVRLYGKRNNILLGTTLIVALFTEKQYYIANIGDSRAYRLEDEITCVTHDHTIVQNEVDSGRMTQEQARESKLNHILTKCVGVAPTVDADFFFGNIKNNSVYLLCTDGFYRKLEEFEMLAYFEKRSEACEETLRYISLDMVKLDRERNENDNISVISVLKK